MRGRIVAIWALLTFGLALALFAVVLPIYNREKSSGNANHASLLLLGPFAIQVLWFIGGAVYSGHRESREPMVGILLGFGLEFLAMAGLVVFAASSHF